MYYLIESWKTFVIYGPWNSIEISGPFADFFSIPAGWKNWHIFCYGLKHNTQMLWCFHILWTLTKLCFQASKYLEEYCPLSTSPFLISIISEGSRWNLQCNPVNLCSADFDAVDSSSVRRWTCWCRYSLSLFLESFCISLGIETHSFY